MWIFSIRRITFSLIAEMRKRTLLISLISSIFDTFWSLFFVYSFCFRPLILARGVGGRFSKAVMGLQLMGVVVVWCCLALVGHGVLGAGRISDK